MSVICVCFNLLTICVSRSWNSTAVNLLSRQLHSDSTSAVAVSLAAEQLPEFGVDNATIRSVGINDTIVSPIATANGTAYLISIQMTVVLVGPRSDLKLYYPGRHC